MLFTYLSLLLAWFFFGLIHSVLSSSRVKMKAEGYMKRYFRFYRILYSIFATFSLCVVLYFHFMPKSYLLWHTQPFENYLSILAITAGAYIMMICVYKYFFDLSGIDAILGKKHIGFLQEKGMNAYVRHPLYFGTLLFVWAIFFRFPYLNNAVSCLCITLYTVIGIYYEEKKLVIDFGVQYQSYQKRVPALVPFTKRK